MPNLLEVHDTQRHQAGQHPDRQGRPRQAVGFRPLDRFPQAARLGVLPTPPRRRGGCFRFSGGDGGDGDAEARDGRGGSGRAQLGRAESDQLDRQ